MRSGGFQRLAACVLNAAAMTRKLPTLEAPYRQPPSTAIEKDGIPIRPDCSAFPLGEERKRGRSHIAAERSQRPRLEVPSGVSGSVVCRRHQSCWLRSRQVVHVLAHVRLVTRVEDLEGQNRELQAQNQELRNRLGALEKNFANYSRADLLRALRREYETTAAQLEEMKHRVDSLWGLRKEQKSAIRMLDGFAIRLGMGQAKVTAILSRQAPILA
ncbi:hypothetical protein AeMF1_005562 [Aphanomyces euteiches]|nr:hypothetical protein AeMF1_005562 [Aphanomyces euteiches]